MSSVFNLHKLTHLKHLHLTEAINYLLFLSLQRCCILSFPIPFSVVNCILWLFLFVALQWEPCNWMKKLSTEHQYGPPVFWCPPQPLIFWLVATLIFFSAMFTFVQDKKTALVLYLFQHLREKCTIDNSLQVYLKCTWCKLLVIKKIINNKKTIYIILMQYGVCFLKPA